MPDELAGRTELDAPLMNVTKGGKAEMFDANLPIIC